MGFEPLKSGGWRDVPNSQAPQVQGAGCHATRIAYATASGIDHSGAGRPKRRMACWVLQKA